LLLFFSHRNHNNIFIISDCPKEDVPCQEDIVSLDAIKTLHKQIDDDESGNIDKNESKEVCYTYNKVTFKLLVPVVFGFCLQFKYKINIVKVL
jgi:hypothetical protein